MDTLQQTIPQINDNEIALDFLQTINSGILMYSMALTETANIQARKVLTDQLRASLSLQKETADLLVSKGWVSKPPRINL